MSLTDIHRAAAVAGDSACRRGIVCIGSANSNIEATPVFLGGSKGCTVVLEAYWVAQVLRPGISGALVISSMSEKLVRTVGC